MARHERLNKAHLKRTSWEAKIALLRFRVEVAVTIVLLVASLYVILADSKNPNQQWAIGSVGVVCGYWLRPNAQISPKGRQS